MEARGGLHMHCVPHGGQAARDDMKNNQQECWLRRACFARPAGVAAGALA